MATYIWPLTPVSVVGVATETTALAQLVQLQDINTNTSDVATATKQDQQTALLTTIDADTSTLAATDFATETTLQTLVASTNRLQIQYQADSPLLDASSTNIPASGGSPLELVASAGGDICKVVTVEDIGEFMGLYVGPAGLESLLAILPLGGGELELLIGTGDRVSIRNMKNAAITSGNFAINFLG